MVVLVSVCLICDLWEGCWCEFIHPWAELEGVKWVPVTVVTLSGSGVSIPCQGGRAGMWCACVLQHLCSSAQPEGCSCEWDCKQSWEPHSLLATSPMAWEREGCWSRAVGLSRQPCGDSRVLFPLLPVAVSGFCSAAGNMQLSRWGRNCIWTLPCSSPGLCFQPWLCFCPKACSAKPPLCRGDVGEADARGAVALTWTGDLLQGPPHLLGVETCCAGSAWGVPSATTCLKRCQGQTNGNITAVLTTLRGLVHQFIPAL